MLGCFLKLLAGQLLGKQLFEHLHLGRERVGTLLVVAGLDGSLQRLLGLLDDAFRHIVDVLLGDVVLSETGATTKKEMGRVMGELTKRTGGNFDKAAAAKELQGKLA